ncbi:O-antigen ligase family protein [Candidatus Gottesmanbacteria bacterium]|nr:O-antigen ligase family protein [Candidatus Gottesmanbacteria bacterium]
MSLILFYLFLFFLPTQLAHHFFFDFTTISGIRSDYLTPTIYLTDIISLFLIGSGLFAKLKKKPTKKSEIWKVILLLFFCYLLFNSFFVAVNIWAALYKFIKILELILLGIAISRLKPKLKTTVSILSLSMVYLSVMAVWQFMIQKSIGGIFWWLGERAFYANTPGIAAFSYKGSLLLRPYATLPHPNVLGGYLSITFLFIFYFLVSNWRGLNKWLKFYFGISIVLGLAALILTFSRVAWVVALSGLVMIYLDKKINLSKKINGNKNKFLASIYLAIIVSVVLPFFSPNFLIDKFQYWQERVSLIKTTVNMVLVNLLFGTGLNNSITQVQNYINTFPGLYIFQPVHNIYLLILSETGIVGFLLFLLLTIMYITRIFKSPPIFLYIFIQLFILGLFDHYLFTLQQGQLLLVVFTALSFSLKMA